MNRTKNYYTSISVGNIRNVESSTMQIFNTTFFSILDVLHTDLFVDKTNPLLEIEITTLSGLIINYPNYKLTDSLNIMVQLVDTVRNLRELVVDLKTQVAAIFHTDDKQRLLMTETKIIQDTNIKLEYLQYLLMFDIKISNGLFLQANLEAAREVLRTNGYRLQTYENP